MSLHPQSICTLGWKSAENLPNDNLCVDSSSWEDREWLWWGGGSEMYGFLWFGLVWFVGVLLKWSGGGGAECSKSSECGVSQISFWYCFMDCAISRGLCLFLQGLFKSSSPFSSPYTSMYSSLKVFTPSKERKWQEGVMIVEGSWEHCRGCQSWF